MIPSLVNQLFCSYIIPVWIFVFYRLPEVLYRGKVGRFVTFIMRFKAHAIHVLVVQWWVVDEDSLTDIKFVCALVIFCRPARMVTDNNAKMLCA